MKPVAICISNNPSKVYEHEDVHYFFWPFELGLTYLKSFKRKWPVFPIKRYDYEPVKELLVGGKTVILTRFHYDIAVYFNSVQTDSKNRPVVDFFFGAHSPYAHTDVNGARCGICQPLNWDEYPARKIDALQFLYSLYMSILARKTKVEKCDTKYYKVDVGKVPNDVLLNPERMHVMIWIGRRPSPEDLVEAGLGHLVGR